MDFRILKNEAEQRAVFDWWLGLEEHKGERAELRRHQHGSEALQSLGTFRLKYRLSKLESVRVSDAATAAVAHVLAYVKADSHYEDKTDDAYFADLIKHPTSLAYLLGAETEQGAERAVFSELRFQRLLQAAADLDDADFDKQMRRAVRQVQGKSEAALNPIVIAEHIFYRYRTSRNPDFYKGRRQFGYQFANDYYQQVFKYQKEA